MVQKACHGKPFSHSGSTHKFQVKECSISLDTEIVKKETQAKKKEHEKTDTTQTKNKDKPKSNSTEPKKKDKPKSDSTEPKKKDKPKSNTKEVEKNVVEYVKSKNDKTEKSETEEIPEKQSTSKSAGLEISTCVAYVKDVSNGEIEVIPEAIIEENSKVEQAKLEIKCLESEIEKLLFT